MNFTLSQKIYITYVKRPMGFLCALLGLVILSPILICTCILLYFANKGAGVFFFQPRPGKDEKVFNVIKFKTMTDERDAEGNLLPDAQRITKVGAFVRKTSIDELPQLINVLKGDMSLIGPRPLLVKYLPYYSEREKLRHRIRPGISGWAQVNGRNFITWDKKLEFDAYYAEHISLAFDVKILFITIMNILKGSSDIQVVLSESNDLDVVRSKQN